jgi:hypothetical protein
VYDILDGKVVRHFDAIGTEIRLSDEATAPVDSDAKP